MPNKILSEMKPIPAEEIALNSEKTAAQIVRVRQALNILQKTLAIEMGITPAYLCDLELNRRDWDLELFNKAKSAMERLAKANPE